MNLDGITDPVVLENLIRRAHERILELESERESSEEVLREQITNAISTLHTLRGPDNPEPPTIENLLAGNVSITEVRTFDAPTLQDHSGLAITLLLGGLQILVETVEAIARVQTATLD